MASCGVLKEFHLLFIWMIVLGWLIQGLALAPELNTRVIEQPVCTVTSQATIVWKPASQDTPLSTTAPTSDRRQKVEFQTSKGKPKTMEMLYGASGRSSGITLTKRNAPENTSNIQYPEGPGVEVGTGSWAFMTFSWPLIWMDSIDAGSIGTTSVMHNQADRADIYLISNKLDTKNPDPISRPPGCTNAESHMYIRIKGQSSGECVGVQKGYQAVRHRYALRRDAQGKVEKVTFIEAKSLRITKNLNGHIRVADDSFLQKVLDCASLQGLYELP